MCDGLCFGKSKRKKLLRIAGDNKIFELMITARKSQNTEQQKAICEKSVTVLEDEAFPSKENARYIVSIIARGYLLFIHQQVIKNGGTKRKI